MQLNALAVMEIEEDTIRSVDRIHSEESRGNDLPMIWRNDVASVVLEDMHDVIFAL
jgi:hypothetical protein